MDPEFAARQRRHQWTFASLTRPNNFSYGNEYADLLTGNISNQYTETNKNRINDIHYTTWEFFGQDSWKATRKLTLEFGLRFSHFSPWIDGEGFGYSIFDLSQFSPDCASSPTFCGFEWHGKNSSVPVGGFPASHFLLPTAIGAAYDVSGPAKQFSVEDGDVSTIIRAIHEWAGCIGRCTTAIISSSNWVGALRLPNQSLPDLRCLWHIFPVLTFRRRLLRRRQSIEG